MPRYWKYLLIFLFASVLLVFLATFSLTDTRLHLVFCDVGQGDAILAYKGSTQILIDGGPDKSVLACLSSHMPFWDRKIELIVLTNADKDHYAGLIDVIRRYQIIKYSSSGVDKEGAGMDALKAELKNRSVPTVDLNFGDEVKLGELKLYTLWPTKAWLARAKNPEPGMRNLVLAATDSPNEFSVVVRLSYGEFDVLLTGDIEPPASDQAAGIVNSESDSEVTWEVLKVPHHGSKNGLTQKLLEAVSPALAVISVGKNNRYGHPSKEALGFLDSLGVRILRTDLDREVEVVTDGKTWSTKVQLSE
ncbi:MAG: MBL fold metallo-hydrolase [bacterium]|nr:MBL fold metallo-hydrolase [bacterium]